ncbi:hypothetical protein ACFY4C_40955 [Actinomadura viridis]|uniref:hypothetical protein n=1 Tax=Actinomadura viridis TaxID=58110 RepID=UPI0036BE8679
MDATGPTAQRFPLLPRPRPVCAPLTTRVEELTELARSAVHDADTAAASAVHNRAALLASDCGLPELARTWCHRHARLYLDLVPLGGKSARCALEPLVNLARLQIRAGRGEAAYQLLTDLYQAVTTRTNTVIAGIELPAAALTADDADHRQLHRWLWSIILAEAPRALISAGRWRDALAHLGRHHGIGHRLLDGRQVAVLATLINGDPAAARAVLDASTPNEPWEHAIAACLAVLCGRTTGEAVSTMLRHQDQLTPAPQLAVFHTRLGLSVLDGAEAANHPGVLDIAAELIQRTLANRDGYALRDLLAHQRCAQLLTLGQASDAHGILQQCALGQQHLPADLHHALTLAMDRSADFLTRALASSGDQALL